MYKYVHYMQANPHKARGFNAEEGSALGFIF